jgi:transcription elongation GreA/GreB family factor
MQGLAVVLFPVLLMLFALAMERLEVRLRRITHSQGDAQEYLDKKINAEVAAAKNNMPDALARFQRLRNRGTGQRTARTGAQLSARAS